MAVTYVAGYDGSASSLNAVQFAVVLSHVDRADVIAAHAYPYVAPVRTPGARPEADRELQDDVRDAGQAVLNALDANGVSRTALVCGPPARALHDRRRGAGLADQRRCHPPWESRPRRPGLDGREAPARRALRGRHSSWGRADGLHRDDRGRVRRTRGVATRARRRRATRARTRRAPGADRRVRPADVRRSRALYLVGHQPCQARRLRAPAGGRGRPGGPGATSRRGCPSGRPAR